MNSLLHAPWQVVMQRHVVNSVRRRLLTTTPNLFKENSPDDNPLRRTFKVIGDDLKKLRNLFPSKKAADDSKIVEVEKPEETEEQNVYEQPLFQTHCDILIIGGGGVGSSTAYWLKKKARDGLNVVVVEKDPTYSKASAAQPFHGLSQQFSLPENIQMSIYAADFLQDAKNNLGDKINLNFTPYGSLTLASEKEADFILKRSKIQTELGVRNEILSPEKLKLKYPWLNTDEIKLGSHCLEREGWFDPLSLLFGYQQKARDYGTHFVNGEVVDFEFQSQQNVMIEGEQSQGYRAIDKAVVRMPNGDLQTVKFAICIIATGSSAGDTGRLAKIGSSTGLLSIPLPVEPRERYAYLINAEGQSLPMFSMPMTIDPNGTYFKRDGLSGNFICGRNFSSAYVPTEVKEGISREEHIFQNEIRPTLEHRVEAFKKAKIERKWSDTYEYNKFDDNGFIGPHPYYNNLYIAIGFNEHGIQQTPAVGRAMSELIIDGRFRTIDLTRFSFDRMVVNQPLYEFATG